MNDPQNWEREAAHINNATRHNNRRGPLRDPKSTTHYVVVDLEFVYDQHAHQTYVICDEQGQAKIRWPFHRIVSVAWLPISFDPEQPSAPNVGELTSIGKPEYGEPAMVSALFKYLEEHPGVIVVTWGGEYKDLPVLRRAAAEYDLCLPTQLRHGRVQDMVHLDLSNAVRGYATPVHLPEYAAAQAVPCKTSLPSKAVGFAAQAGSWDVVKAQAEQDVITTAILLCRHLASNRMIAASGLACDIAIAKSVIATHSHLPFICEYLSKWRNGREMLLAFKAGAAKSLKNEED